MTGVEAPTQISPGQTIRVSWTVTNTGSGPARGDGWHDYVVFSRDDQVDRADIYLTSRWTTEHTPLMPGQSYTYERTVDVPDYVRGEGVILAVADRWDRLIEADEQNNSRGVTARAPGQADADDGGPGDSWTRDNTAITTDQVTWIEDGLQGLSTLAEDVDGLGQFAQPLSFLRTTSDTDFAIGEELDLGGIIDDRLTQRVIGYFNGDPSPTSDELITELATFGDDIDSVGGGLFTGDNEIRFELKATFETDFGDLPIDLGADAEGLGLAIDSIAATVPTDGLVTLDLAFGISLEEGITAEDAFFIRVGASGVPIAASIDVDTASVAFPLNIGFLGLEVSGGAVDLNLSLDVAIDNPDADGAGSITLAEFSGYSADSITTITDAAHSLTGSLPVTVGDSLFTSPGSPEIVITGDPLYDDEPQVTLAAFDEFAQFTLFDSTSLLAELDTLTVWMSSFSRSEVFDDKIPFADVTIGDAADLGEATDARLISPLSTGGEPAFTNAQELGEQLATILGVDISVINPAYDTTTDELTYDVDYADQPLDAFDADVIVPNVGPLSSVTIDYDDPATEPSTVQGSVTSNMVLGMSTVPLDEDETLSDRTFIQTVSWELNITPEVHPVVSEGIWGIVGVGSTDATGDGYATSQMELQDTNGDDQVTIQKLIDASDNPNDLVVGSSPVVTSEFTIVLGDVAVQQGITIPIGATPEIQVYVWDITDPNDVEVSSQDLADLGYWVKMTQDELIETVEAVTNFVDEVISEAMDSVIDSVEAVEDGIGRIAEMPENFLGAMEAIEYPSTVQELEDAIDAAMSGLGDSTVSYNESDTSLDISFDAFLNTVGTLPISVNLAQLAADAGVGGYEDVGTLGEVSGDGSFAADVSAALDLDIGIDLSDPQNPAGFVYDTSSMRTEVQAAGTDLHFSTALGPLGLFVGDGSSDNGSITLDDGAGGPAAFEANLIDDTSGDGKYTLSELGTGILETSASGEVSGELPLYFPTTADFLGDITFGIGDLGDIPGTTSFTGPDLATLINEIDLFDNASSIVDSLDALLLFVEDAVDGEVYGFQLPVVGNGLAGVADVIENFRLDIRTRLDSELDLGALTAAAVQTALEEVLGATDLDLLVGDVTVTASDFESDGVIDQVEFSMDLAQSIVSAGSTIDFDVGLPALGLNIVGDVAVDIGWALSLTFGVHRDWGGYFDTSAANEMSVDVWAGPDSGFSATGSLGFLQLSATDQGSYFGGETESDPASFSVDLLDGGTSGAGEDPGILTFAEALTITDFSQVIDASLVAESHVDLLLVVAADASGLFPSLCANLLVDWTFTDALEGNLPSVTYSGLCLDLGSFFSDLVSPLLERLDNVLEPIRLLVDLLTTPLPVISDLDPSGEVTVLDLAGIGTPGFLSVIQFLDSLSIPSVGDNLSINLGSFGFGDLDLRDVGSVSDLTFDPDWWDDTGFDPWGDIDGGAGEGFGDQVASINGVAEAEFIFPIFEGRDGGVPEAFLLLLGQDASLVELSLPTLELTASLSFNLYLPPPLSLFYIHFAAGMGARAQLAFGYDTAGIRAYADSDFTQPELLYDGFYAADLEGNEFEVFGYIEAGPGIFGFNVLGGVEATVGADLNDEDGDGKLRGKDIQDLWERGGLTCLFGFNGTLDGYLVVEYWTLTGRKEWEITRKTLWTKDWVPDCDSMGDEPPVLATQSGNTLYLNLGTRAADRLYYNTIDGSEYFRVLKNDDGTIYVNAFGYNSEDYSGITTIVADAGEGNDYIDVDETITADVEFTGGEGDDTLYGAAGDDIIDGGSGADVLYGRDGDEYWIDDDDNVQPGLVGGTGNDLIDGGAGFDDINAGDGDDTVYGGDGADEIVGGAGYDTIYGGQGPTYNTTNDGNDYIYGGDDDDYILGEEGDDTIETGQGSDVAYGGDGIDVIWGDDLWGDTPNPETDYLYGGAGGDSIYGSEGDDFIEGGEGDDYLFGELNADTISGGGGADYIEGDYGNDTIAGDAGADEIYGGPDNDTITGGDDADIIQGNSGDDAIEGNAGDDDITGGLGDDTIEGNEGADTISGGWDADSVTGGSGDDRIWGDREDGNSAYDGQDFIDAGAGDDWVYGGGGADTIYGASGADTLRGGDDADIIHGQDGADLILGQGGGDELHGGADDDVLYGAAGPDRILGGGGDDRAFGGEEDDIIQGGTGNDALEGGDGNDTLEGNTGNDQLNGGKGLDTLRGQAGDDALTAGEGLGTVLEGGDGNDHIVGTDEGTQDSDWTDGIYLGDFITGGEGDDVIQGLGGADYIDAGPGDDWVDGGIHGDYILGGLGQDFIYAGLSDQDKLYGDPGDDVIYGSHIGADLIEGGPGDDQIFGQAENDVLRGGDGDDRVDGGIGDDLIEGGAGDDTLFGGGGLDTIRGEDGHDTIYGSDDAADLVEGGPGNDFIYGNAGNDELHGGPGDDVIDGGEGDDEIFGERGSDVLVGGLHHDTIYAFSPVGTDDMRPDSLYGDLGDDDQTLPDAGADWLIGDRGNDLLHGEGNDDLINPGSSVDDLIDYGQGNSTPETYTVPTPTPDPTLDAGTETRFGQGSLPTGPAGRGRWAGLFGSEGHGGLSNAFGIEQSIATSPDGRVYVAWADARNGNYEIYVAEYLPGGGWVELGGSASYGGVSRTGAQSRRPSISILEDGGTFFPMVAWTEFDLSGTYGISNIYFAMYDFTSQTWGELTGSLHPGGVSGSGAADEARLVPYESGGYRVPAISWLDSSSGMTNIRVAQYDGAAADWNGTASGTPTLLYGGGMQEYDFSGGYRCDALTLAWTSAGVIKLLWFGDQCEYWAEWHDNIQDTYSATEGISTGISASMPSIYSGMIAYRIDDGMQSQIHSRRWEVDDPTDLSEGHWVNSATGSDSDGGVSDTPGMALAPSLDLNQLAWIDESVHQDRAGSASIFSTVWDPTANSGGGEFAGRYMLDASHIGISNTARSVLSMSASSSSHGDFIAWVAVTSSGPEVFVRGDSGSAGTIYYVNDSSTDGDVFTSVIGDAANSGTEPDSPMPSIQEVLSTHTPAAGSLILVDTGQYGDPFLIDAAYSQLSILGSPNGASLSGQIDVLDATDITLDAINFTGAFSAIGADGLTALNSSFQRGLTLQTTDDALIEHNSFPLATDPGVTALVVAESTASIVRNTFTGSQPDHTGISVQGPTSSGEIFQNTLSNMGTGLDLAGAFAGTVYNNTISDNDIGILYTTGADLADNLITGNEIGVQVAVQATEGLGLVGSRSPNTIEANEVGVEILDGTVANQLIRANTIGVSGSGGILGGDTFEAANLIQDNLVGVLFAGTVQYNYIAGNTVGIDAVGHQTITHNVLTDNSTVGIHVNGVTDARIVHDSIRAQAGDAVRVESASTETEILNNILWADQGAALALADDSRAGLVSDYNTLHATGAAALVDWGATSTDLLDWRIQGGRYDLHSLGATSLAPVGAMPRFADALGSDYNLLAPVAGRRVTSPAVDAGIPGIDLGVTDAFNLLHNPGFEEGLTGWATNPSASAGVATPDPFEADNYFVPGTDADAFAAQPVDVSSFAADIDALDAVAIFGGRLRAEPVAAPGSVTATILFRAGDATILGSLDAEVEITEDRWALFGNRALVPIDTRTIEFRVESTAAGSTNGGLLDSTFLRVLPESFGPGMGAAGWSDAQLLGAGGDLPMHIAVRNPDLYLDWEAGESHTILWDTFNNTDDRELQIDLYIDSPRGPRFHTQLTPATPDDGEFTWMPSDYAIAPGTLGLRVQMSVAADAFGPVNYTILDRTLESFAVPESGGTFYADDASDIDDEYTPSAAGDNRNTGKLDTAPKANPLAILASYRLDGGAILSIDTGSYDIGRAIEMVEPTGYLLRGPTDTSRTAAIDLPGTHAPAIDINSASMGRVRDLTISGGDLAVRVTNTASGVELNRLDIGAGQGHGVLVDQGPIVDLADDLTIHDRAGSALYIDGGVVGAVRRLTATDNASGVNFQSGALNAIEDSTLRGNSIGAVLHAETTVQTSIIADNNGAGVQTSAPLTIGQSTLSGNQTGILSTATEGALTISNSVFYGNTEDAIRLDGNAGGTFTADLVNNTILQRIGSGIRASDSDNIILRNNIIWAEGDAAIDIAEDAQAGFLSEHNLLRATGSAVVGRWGPLNLDLTGWRRFSGGDAYSFGADPLFADVAAGDYRLRSTAGRWDPGTETFVNDTVRSPAIDRGDAADSYGNETANNGGYINLGAYGNTAEASRSPDDYLLLMLPAGGEFVLSPDTLTIEWRSGGSITAVDIAYSATGFAGPFADISTAETNDGDYAWNTSDQPTSTAYALRLTDNGSTGAVSLSTGLFTIRGVPGGGGSGAGEDPDSVTRA